MCFHMIQDAVMISKVLDRIEVMKSKQKPKRIILIGTDGKEYPWLIKHENTGDLRKDSRLLEVAGYMNAWLTMSNKCRRKSLHVSCAQFCPLIKNCIYWDSYGQARRYSVIAVNETTGFIEWLPNLMAMRIAITESWRCELGVQSFELYQRKVTYGNKHYKYFP